MKCFVIGKKTHPEIANRLINACDRHGIPTEEVIVNDGSALTTQDITRITRFPECEGMTRGDICRALAHIQIYQTMIKENIQNALVISDLAVMDDDVFDVVRRLIKIQSKDTPTVTLLGGIETYLGKNRVPISEKYLRVSVITAADVCGFFVNLAAAKALYAFLYPIWLEPNEWEWIRIHQVVNLFGVLPQCVRWSSEAPHNVHVKDDKFTRELAKTRTLTRNRLRRNRPLGLKLKMLFWRTLIRPFSDIRSV